MKIVFAPDSFKGTLSADRICELLKKEAERVFPGCETVSVPVSDGGEGASDVIVSALNGYFREVTVRDPMGKQVAARYGIYHQDCAVIEMAAASGLTLVPEEERNVRRASTYGTGEMILDALEQGIRRFCIAIGGSATNDGGIGCASALGVRFLDQTGKELEALPENLGRIASVDLDGRDGRIADSEFVVMCDVTNPLLGPTGATFVFGPQKGATEADRMFLENGMKNYAAVLQRTFGRDIASMPGSGAAGGLGAGLMAFFDARLNRGIETILDILEFDRVIEDADLIITGEGRMDGQSACGKVPYGVGMAARRHGIPCLAVVGGMEDGAEALYDCGVDSIITTINGAMEIGEALERAEELFAGASRRMFRMVRTGMQVKDKQLMPEKNR
ncbi:MAG: glycerate kinase [Candidatus Choladocola sp.]|nr:glycerate kinase [Candidatus Choladocola sp.]